MTSARFRWPGKRCGRRRSTAFRVFVVLCWLLLAAAVAAVIGASVASSDFWMKRLVANIAWYAPFLRGGTIDERLVAAARIIRNGHVSAPLQKAHAFRVVALGGSTTFGEPFAPGDPRTWVEILQNKLRDQFGDAEAINLGVVGETFALHLSEIFRIVVAQMQPDVVVVDNVFNNFFADQKIVVGLLCVVRLPPRRPAEPGRRFRHAIQEMIDVARQNNCLVVFVEEPVNVEYFRGRNPTQRYQAALVSLCEANGAPVVRVQNEFAAHAGPPLFFDFAHLTPDGNKLLAERIDEQIWELRGGALPQPTTAVAASSPPAK